MHFQRGKQNRRLWNPSLSQEGWTPTLGMHQRGLSTAMPALQDRQWTQNWGSPGRQRQAALLQCAPHTEWDGEKGVYVPGKQCAVTIDSALRYSFTAEIAVKMKWDKWMQFPSPENHQSCMIFLCFWFHLCNTRLRANPDKKKRNHKMMIGAQLLCLTVFNLPWKYSLIFNSPSC